MRAWTVIAAAIGLALTSSAAQAERTPPPGTQDSRVRVVSYNPDEVYRIRGVFRTASQIVFAPGETIASVALGDTVSWEVAPAENVLLSSRANRPGPPICWSSPKTQA